MNYKTPGVYVEEHEKFPPSVAQVETAIPAFIGYTEEGELNKPTRISSMLEYENLFGKANPETFAVAFKDGVATATQPKVSDFKMYYAMQMYFANGGGPCYIISVGNYSEVKVDELQAGLKLLRKEDEPTLIVFPDLQGLVATDAEVYNASVAKIDAEKAFDAAALAETAAETAAGQAAAHLTQAEQDDKAAQAASDADPGDAALAAAAVAAAAALVAAKKASDAAEQALSDATADKFTLSAIKYDAAGNFNKVEFANSDLSITKAYSLYNDALRQAEALKDRFVIMDVLGNDVIFRREVGTEGLNYGAAYHPKLKTALTYDFSDSGISVTGVSGVTTLEALKFKNSELYNQAKKAIEAEAVVLSPSSAIAGVYATVDNTSGVFKAPANIGLNYVVAPVSKISNKEQDDLNVDTSTGKSINAIRAFAGKGTLVWGARTLDGNSNEWRYISVRRFFSMVEESVKKATERFVFEPNTANTWIRVQTMIENFLNQQWQDGALAGSKPEEAYYVSVGLNKTMSAQDILEGRMNIEIGMAAVRPAEFIVLRFSHKLQEA
ncbi:phage tail sheath C-terminal domain-containing protein [Chryseobacterium sp. MYb264]|uniref:phage tail sheath family protein n=1 Tax=Chryseobacterium sp. MYb264 TaxID=2745153 RepID=UPI002E153255|nr:phage tail sheath C-terminal domain-containing protein [Chryseobacterium sp. MYb264]